MPTAAATNETDEETLRDKFITCVFLQEWIPKSMKGRLKTELNYAYVAGQKQLPKDGRE